MDNYAIFDSYGNFVGIRLSVPKPEENLQHVKLVGKIADDFKLMVKPKFDNGDIIETATATEIIDFNKNSVPPTISRMKFRIQLILMGISISSIYEAIEAITDQDMKDIILTKFECAVVIERSDVSLNQMAQQLGISQQQLDDIFIQGNLL